MAVETMGSNTQSIVKARRTLFTGKRGRILKENLTAYLFLFPAMSLVFVFGIFPVGFALYVSMYKWKIKQSTFRGLGNYVRAMDVLAYVVAFVVAFAALGLVLWLLVKLVRTAREREEAPWLLWLPGAFLAWGLYQFITFTVVALPEFLAIGEKVQRVERTRELYLQLFREAFITEATLPHLYAAVGFIALGLILYAALVRVFKSSFSANYLYQFFSISFFALTAYLVFTFTYNQLQAVQLEALEAGQTFTAGRQILSVFAGLIALGLSWFVWRWAGTQESSTKTIAGLFAGIALISSAWMLIAELPLIIEASDEALWAGFRVTAWFSFFTVPLQLALGLGIAYLLYQEIRGQSFFRMIYFLPYITPAVASAAVFRIMFSNRPSGMMNSVLGVFGFEPLKWLLEPEPLFVLFGIDGPSLALMVIILFNVWTYTGYNAVIFLAGLGGIPTSLYEAAEIDGANRWQVFKNITLPLLSPITYFLSLLGVIGTFKAFNHVFILRNPAALDTVDTMSMVIWDLLKVDNRYGYASAMAFALFGVVLILTLINNSLQGKRVFYG